MGDAIILRREPPPELSDELGEERRVLLICQQCVRPVVLHIAVGMRCFGFQAARRGEQQQRGGKPEGSDKAQSLLRHDRCSSKHQRMKHLTDLGRQICYYETA